MSDIAFDKLPGKCSLILSSSAAGAVLLCKGMLTFYSHSERQKRERNMA